MEKTKSEVGGGPVKYSGIVIVDFTLGTKSPKVYHKGAEFSTENKAFYDDLLTKKIIK